MKRIDRLQRAYYRYGFQGLIRRGLQQPSRALDLFLSPSEHFYTLELPVYWEDIVTIVPPLLDVSPSSVTAVWREIREDNTFASRIEDQLSKTDERPSNLHSNWREFLYVLVRIQKPDQIVETGIYDGLSSAYILAGLEENGVGELTSIDINDETRLPSDIDDRRAGWLVPDSLRNQWNIRYADAREVLPEVVAERPPDIFIHDSLHTAEHMRFEFETSTSQMEDGGLVVTDNCRFNDVFRSFAQREFTNTAFWKNTKYAYNLSGEKIDDRFGVGILG